MTTLVNTGGVKDRVLPPTIKNATYNNNKINLIYL